MLYRVRPAGAGAKGSSRSTFNTESGQRSRIEPGNIDYGVPVVVAVDLERSTSVEQVARRQERSTEVSSEMPSHRSMSPGREAESPREFSRGIPIVYLVPLWAINPETGEVARGPAAALNSYTEHSGRGDDGDYGEVDRVRDSESEGTDGDAASGIAYHDGEAAGNQRPHSGSGGAGEHTSGLDGPHSIATTRVEEHPSALDVDARLRLVPYPTNDDTESEHGDGVAVDFDVEEEEQERQRHFGGSQPTETARGSDGALDGGARIDQSREQRPPDSSLGLPSHGMHVKASTGIGEHAGRSRVGADLPGYHDLTEGSMGSSLADGKS